MTTRLEAHDVAVDLGGRRVLDGVSLALRAGEWAAIVGPNGAGKSTLLAVLAGLRRPAAGRVELDGRPIDAWPALERARRVAWLSQHGEAEGEIGVRDVVRLGRLPHHGVMGAPGTDDERAVDAALAETETAGFVQRRLGELSGGERQRVLIARAFAVGAPVLLLDALVAGLRWRARAGVAVAAVLHDLTLALAADRLLVLAGGRLRADGAPGDPAVQAALVDVFGGAIDVARLHGDQGAGGRWVAVPTV